MIPENCKECPFSYTCKAGYYGGSRCSYEKEISQKALERLR